MWRLLTSSVGDEHADLLVDLVLRLAWWAFLKVRANPCELSFGEFTVDEFEKLGERLLTLPLSHGSPPQPPLRDGWGPSRRS